MRICIFVEEPPCLINSQMMASKQIPDESGQRWGNWVELSPFRRQRPATCAASGTSQPSSPRYSDLQRYPNAPPRRGGRNPDIVEQPLSPLLEGFTEELYINKCVLLDRVGLTKVIRLHGDPTATRAGIFHGCQFVPAHMFCIRLGRAAKTALGRISTRIAQMSRFTCNRSAILTGVSHIFPPLLRSVLFLCIELPLSTKERMSTSPRIKLGAIYHFAFIIYSVEINSSR